MNKKRLIRKIKQIPIALYVAAAVFVAAVLLIVFLVTASGHQSAEVQQGVEYIKTAESLDTAAIENQISEIDGKSVYREIREAYDADPSYVWTALTQINTAIIGDSRAIDFQMFMSGVYGNVGDSILNLPDYYEALKVQNPTMIVVSYGLNDVMIYDAPEEHVYDYIERLTRLRELFPDAYIYVINIIEALPQSEDLRPDFCSRIVHFNEVEVPALTEAGFNVIDCVPLGRTHTDLYEPDGMHFTPAFYPYWGQEILNRFLSDVN